VQHRPPADGVVRDALALEFFFEHALAEHVDEQLDIGAAVFFQRLDQCLLAAGKDACEAHAVGRQHAREGVNEDRLHAQRIGDQAGVLAAGAAEAVERVAGDVIAALHRDLLDGVGHVLDGDA
jgi:hypothetical protein